MKTPITNRPVRQSSALDPFEKGRLFEQYVIELFNQDNFKLTNYRKSEKFIGNVSLQDCNNPDLELIFDRNKKYPFAVECKWREKFHEGKITWAKDHQIYFYKK